MAERERAVALLNADFERHQRSQKATQRFWMTVGGACKLVRLHRPAGKMIGEAQLRRDVGGLRECSPLHEIDDFLRRVGCHRIRFGRGGVALALAQKQPDAISPP